MYKLGKGIDIWNEGVSQTLTFIVTEDCNLRCGYCYITHKSSNRRMEFTTAKKFIDYVLSEDILRPNGVVLDFIGGEPLLEIKLIDKICDYFKLKSYLMKDEWYWDYRINITTNGIDYLSEEVQSFIDKNQGKLEISITIDGIKDKHDMHRVFPGGEGSYDKVIESVELYKNQFEASTKVTFASKDLKYLKDSIIHLWEMGIPEIAANVVFEDVWEEGDDKIFQNQLEQLADYVIDNKLFDRYSCTFFDEGLGLPNNSDNLQMSSCGAGKMIALGPDGTLYPCMRYKDYSLNNKVELSIGNVDEGINFDRVRPYYLVNTKLQSDDECTNCRVATGCSSCFGHNYDVADTNTNFQRAKYICSMHKARVRANNYYFSELYNKYGIKREVSNDSQDKLYFLLSESPVKPCIGSRNHKGTILMGENTIKKGLEFARENFLSPVFIHDRDKLCFDFEIDEKGHNIYHICSAKNQKEIKAFTDNYILVLELEDSSYEIRHMSFEDNVILNVPYKNIADLYLMIRVSKVNQHICNQILSY